MRRTRFTPGPWVMGRESDNTVTFSGDECSWKDFATAVVRMAGEVTDDPEGIANAHLIAAAPELYEALAAAESWIADGGYLSNRDPYTAESAQAIINQVVAALRKARGEA